MWLQKRRTKRNRPIAMIRVKSRLRLFTINLNRSNNRNRRKGRSSRCIHQNSKPRNRLSIITIWKHSIGSGSYDDDRSINH